MPIRWQSQVALLFLRVSNTIDAFFQSSRSSQGMWNILTLWTAATNMTSITIKSKCHWSIIWDVLLSYWHHSFMLIWTLVIVTVPKKPQLSTTSLFFWFTFLIKQKVRKVCFSMWQQYMIVKISQYFPLSINRVAHLDWFWANSRDLKGGDFLIITYVSLDCFAWGIPIIIPWTYHNTMNPIGQKFTLLTFLLLINQITGD